MKYIKILAVALATAAFAPSVQAQTTALEADSTTVAVATTFGAMMRQQIGQFAMIGIKVDDDAFLQVFRKAFMGEPTGMTFAQADDYMNKVFTAAMQGSRALPALSDESQKAFIDSIAALPGAVTTQSGLVFIPITEGNGAAPDDSSIAVVKYTGRLADGKIFDDHQAQTVEFPVNALIPGFSEGLKMMKTGGTYRLIIPASIGYGMQGAGPDIPGNAALDFTVTLEGVK